MAQTPEGKVKAKLVKRLNAAGFPYNTVTTRGYGRGGHPDYTVNARGRYVLVETKAEAPTPTALQHKELVRHSKAGALGFCLGRTGLRVYLPSKGEDYLRKKTKTVEDALDALMEILELHVS